MENNAGDGTTRGARFLVRHLLNEGVEPLWTALDEKEQGGPEVGHFRIPAGAKARCGSINPVGLRRQLLSRFQFFFGSKLRLKIIGLAQCLLG